MADASAVLALLLAERGGDLVREAGADAAVSTVNWVEVTQRLLGFGGSPSESLSLLAEAGVALEPLTVEDAETAARLRPATRDAGLSLADRCCFALALRLDRPMLTADRAWAEVETGVDVRLIR